MGSTADDNSKHVIFVEEGTSDVLLDGFFITRGNSTEKGGGAAHVRGSLELRNCFIYGNQVSEENVSGGGIYVSEKSSGLTLTNCVFYKNTVNVDGGSGGRYLHRGRKTYHI